MARSLAYLIPAFAGAALMGALAAGCGTSPNQATGGAATTGAGGATGGATSGTATGGTGTAGTGTAGGGGISGGCDPACVDPQVCSVAHLCIDKGTCAGDGDCNSGEKCDLATKQCVPGGDCGSKKLKADIVAPNLLIVLDRSCSMTEKVGAAGETKWQIAVQAITTMTTEYAGKIRFGLTLFPDLVNPACGQDVIPIPVAPQNEMPIQELLKASLANNDKYFPKNPCVTNIDTAMQQATTEPAFMDKDRQSYALLLTDGKQSNTCDQKKMADMITTQTIKTMHDTQNVPTFVLGFGTGIDPTQMNIFADAGGEPAGDPQKYYDASDQASLDAALKAIAQKTFGCVFQLDETPPNPDEIYVFFNGKDSVGRDATHMKGWDYDAAKNQVTFYGMECSDLKAGKVNAVDIVFGCNAPPPT